MAQLAVFLALLVAIAASPSIANPTAPSEVPGFLYFGTANTTDGRQFNDKFYFASVNSGDWNTAKEDCKVAFGPTGHLLSIESESEQKFIYNWLKEHSNESTTTLYWTSGIYDETGNAAWRWSSSGESLHRLYTNWDPVESIAEFSISRIALEHKNQFSAFWLSRLTSGLYRYVCELPDPATAVNY